MSPWSSPRARLLLAFLAGALLSTLMAFLVSQGLDRSDKWASVIGLAVGLMGLALGVRATRSTQAFNSGAVEPAREEASSNVTVSMPSATHFFYDTDNPSEIEYLMKSSKELWLWGATLTMHIPYFAPLIEDQVSKGLDVRIMLIAPDSSSLRLAAFRASKTSSEQLNKELRDNIARLQLMLSRLNSRPDPNAVHGNLQVRIVDYLAPYALYAYDPGDTEGTIEVRLTTFRGTHYARPTFKLKADRDGQWYEHFRTEFLKVWGVATPLNREPNG